MKKFFKGFTLMELIIAIAIIGIVATLVTPVLHKNIQRKKNAVVLGKAIEQITLGSQNLIQTVNAYRTDGSFSDCLSTITMADAGGTENDSLLANNNLRTIIPHYWDLSTIENEDEWFNFNKISASLQINCNDSNLYENPDDNTECLITIDTNGVALPPGRAGVDIFEFILINNGSLTPNIGTESGIRARDLIQNDYIITE